MVEAPAARDRRPGAGPRRVLPTYDQWKTEILNYFDARQTSAAVEGINNKSRVITKRTYGLKSAESLWTRRSWT